MAKPNVYDDEILESFRASFETLTDSDREVLILLTMLGVSVQSLVRRELQQCLTMQNAVENTAKRGRKILLLAELRSM